MGTEIEDPLQSFRFLVSVGGGQVAAAFTRLSGIQMQVMTVEGRTGDENRGVAEILPVMTRFSPVTLSRGVVGDFDFMDWLLSASAGDFEGPTGVNLMRDIDIIAINSQGIPGVTWTLMNAFPIGYELSPMDASRSEVLVENITFANTGLKRTTGSHELREVMTSGQPGAHVPQAASQLRQKQHLAQTPRLLVVKSLNRTHRERSVRP